MKKAPKQPATARDTLFSYLFGSNDVAGKKIVDLFAGGGGVSLGIELALGRSPDVAINHDEEAIAMHQANHPNTRHYRSDVFEVDPHEAVGDSPVALLWLSPDCFPAGTLVLTEHGYVPIETVKVGERVLTHAGNWKSVTETSSTRRPLMTIRGYGHPGLAVSPEHPFYVRHGKKGKPTWAPASTLSKEHYWATPTSFGVKCLQAPAVQGRGLRFDERLLWLAGQYISNGWTRLTDDRAELVITTGKHKADALREKLNRWQRRGERSGEGELAWHGRETGTAYQFTTSHRGLVEWLRENFGHLAEHKSLPGWAYQLPAHLREELLGGYLEGDGSSNGTVQECSTVSKALAFSIKSLAESLGKSVTVFLSSNPDSIQGRPVNAKPIYQVRWRHELKRMQTVRHAGLEWAPIREVTAPEGEETVYNIGVQDDESYVVEGIVVHNCKHHSTAKGGKPLDQKIRSLAWVGLKWAGKVKPDVIVLENVPAFRSWGRLVAQRGVTGEDGKKVKLPWPNKPKRRGKACRRFMRGMAKQQPPRGPVMYGEDGRQLRVADKRKRYAGKTFRRFVSELRRLGYVVDWRMLRADAYGVPTIRERFFLVARRDGKAIVWPQATHGAGLKAVRTAAECIDWSIPTRTIFEQHATRRTDLAENTLRRVAMGLDRFVLGTQRPFLVQCNHGGHDSRSQSVDQPSITVTGSHGTGVVTPYLAPMNFENAAVSVEAPAQTVTTQGNRHTLVEPQIAPLLAPPRAVAHVTHFRTGQVGAAPTQPLGTICAGGGTARPGASSTFGVVSAYIVRNNGGGLAPQHAPYAVTEPARAVLAQGGPQSLTAVSLVQYNGTASAQSVDKPSQTMSTVERFGLTTATMLRIDNKSWCTTGAYDIESGLGTITTKNGYALGTAYLATYYGDKADGGDARGAGLHQPVATIPTENRHALMMAHVLRQFGTGDGRSADAPLGSQTTCVKDGIITTSLTPGLDAVTLAGARRVYRFLAEFCPAALDKVPAGDRALELVTLVVDGEKYVIWDIGMRMLEPQELYRCQGFPDTYIIDFSVKGRPLSKAAQVRMCGNSVPPLLVSAIIGAQFGQELAEAAD